MGKVSKAFIMCAGLGTRLRPLTYDTPKPMIRISNKPLLQNSIELLKKYGITDITLNLHLHPEQIKDYFGDGSKFGVNISYSYEKELLGTAGGLGKVRHKFDDTFIVLSGDGLIDLDLEAVLKYHESKESLATIVLKRYNEKFKYGVVFVDDSNNQVQKFVEKPNLKDIYENRVNVGVYILEPKIFDYIPEHKFYDFGHDLWPDLMQRNIPIYTYEMDGYWCDVGNLNAYRFVQKHVLDNKDNNSFISTKDAIFLGTTLIGKNCKISKNVEMGEYNVLGDNCVVSNNVIMKNNIIGNNVKIAKNVELFDCIIMDNIEVKEGTRVYGGMMVCERIEKE